MADNYKGGSKLVTSDYLYRTLKAEDDRRAKKLHDSLFVDHETVIEHYTLADPQDGSVGLLVVDKVVSSPDSEVLLSDVQAKLLPDDLTVYAAGQYVILVPEVPAYSEEIYLKQADLIMETEELDLWGDVLPIGAEPIPDEEIEALYNEIYNKVFGGI